jgi:hypothetical protein
LIPGNVDDGVSPPKDGVMSDDPDHEDQRAKLAEIAEKTPVTRAVRAGTEIRTTTVIP